MWREAKRFITGGQPDWCTSEDCDFYGTTYCTECEECTYCGTSIGPKGRNRHKSHLIARTSGGRKWVPTCMSCNLSQRQDGLITWLRRLHEEDHALYKKIVFHTRSRWFGWSGKYDHLARRIEELDEKLDGHYW